MELTRRDALIALFGGTSATAAVGAGAELLADSGNTSLNNSHIEQLRVIATVLYPSMVDVTREFVETYVLGRVDYREDYQDGIVAALDAVQTASKRRYGQPVTSLSESEVDDLLRAMGVATVYPVPDGTIPEQVKYYVINDLLYALYTTPVGGQLVDYENPDGYPGGTDAYQRGPDT